jgi:hypothetical protein
MYLGSDWSLLAVYTFGGIARESVAKLVPSLALHPKVIPSLVSNKILSKQPKDTSLVC